MFFHNTTIITVVTRKNIINCFTFIIFSISIFIMNIVVFIFIITNDIIKNKIIDIIISLRLKLEPEKMRCLVFYIQLKIEANLEKFRQ